MYRLCMLICLLFVSDYTLCSTSSCFGEEKISTTTSNCYSLENECITERILLYNTDGLCPGKISDFKKSLRQDDKVLDIELINDRVCVHEGPIILEIDPILSVPEGGVFTLNACLFCIDNQGNQTPFPNAISINEFGEYIWDPRISGEGTFIIEYCVNDECGLDVLTVDAINQTFFPVQNEVCANEAPIKIITSNDEIVTGTGTKKDEFGQWWFDPAGLDAGDYEIAGTTVLEAFNTDGLLIHTCSKTSFDTVTVIPSPEVSLMIEQHSLCEGDPVRLIPTVSLTSPDPSLTFSYSWEGPNMFSSNQDTVILESPGTKDAGNYILILSISNGCFVTETVNLEISGFPDLSCDATSPVRCSGEMNGIAEITTNLDSVLTILWDNGENTPEATMLSTGFHQVTVTDLNGCTNVCEIEILEPDEIQIDITIQANVLCNGEDNGIATAAASGGNEGYLYLWSTGETTETASMLVPGLNTVTVTDILGCSDTESVNITESPELSCSAIEEQPVTCFGGNDGMASVMVEGGTPDYQFLWSTGHTGSEISNIQAGDYMVTITDDNDCTITCFTTIDQPDDPPYAGEENSIMICNAEVPGTVDLYANLLGNPDPSGIWEQTSGPETIVINQANIVNFMGMSSGDYTFRYAVETDDPLCPLDSSEVVVQVFECFDLALKKVTVPFRQYEPGEIVRFDMEVHNQGEVDAHDVVVTDYIQSGLIFDESRNTSALTGNKNNWVKNGNNAEISVGMIPAFSMETVSIFLKIEDNFEGVRVDNYAEITEYSNGVIAFPPDEDDEEFYIEEIDDDIRDESTGSADNPGDDDQFDFAYAPLCEVPVLACNQDVQLSLDDDCQLEVTLDMILEGSAYPCASDFRIEVDGVNGNIITRPGTYVVTVTSIGEIENHCWGVIYAEDKIGPELMCMNQSVPCSNSLLPGDEIIRSSRHAGYYESIGPVNSDLNDHIISGGEDTTAYWNFDLNIGPEAIVKEIEVKLSIDHEKIDELTGILISPQNDTVELFSNIQQANVDELCLKKGLFITLSDFAGQTYEELSLDPRTCLFLHDPSVIGEFRPKEMLSGFRDSLANGLWRFCLRDEIADIHHGKIDSVLLRISTSSESIKFPINASGATFIPVSNNEFEIIGLDSCGAKYAIYEDEYIEECTEEELGRIVRTWVVKDLSGNANSCIQIIGIEKGEIINIQWPENYDDVEFPSFRCQSDFPEEYTLPNGAPSPKITGKPYFPDLPGRNLCKNVEVTFQDVIIPVCGFSIKIIRYWKAIDWCLGKESILEHAQIIKIVDDLEPLCHTELPSLIEVPLDEHAACTATFEVPSPHVLFECHPYIWWIEYLAITEMNPDGSCKDPQNLESFSSQNIKYTNGSGYVDASISGEKATITGLPPGCVWIRYTLEDECGNISKRECLLEIKVIDTVEPVAVCDERTAVTLGSNGIARVYAENFDDQSWDNCELDSFAVRKLVAGLNCEKDYEHSYKPYVEFCCEDVENSLQVEVLVVDKSGNANTCIVEVEVKDKLPPYLDDCPPDITLDCNTDFNNTFLIGIPVAQDNCGIADMAYIDKEMLSLCGEGTVSRTWNVEDKSGNNSQCHQKITIKEFDTFNMMPHDWPSDMILIGCGHNTDPSILGRPDTDHDQNCSLVAVSYQDTKFPFVDEACYIIVRHWTVIDWCQYNIGDSQSSEGYWKENQMITVDNLNPPDLSISCRDTVICQRSDNCYDQIPLIVHAVDDCTPAEELDWHWKVYLHNGGFPDFPTFTGFSNDATGHYPLGTHRIIWTVEDGCGNISTCDYAFTVVDCKEPVPYCISAVSTVLMPIGGEVTIWAEDFNAGSSDNCAPDSQLSFSFSRDIDDKYRIIDCSYLQQGAADTLGFHVWVTDLAGNQDFCQIELIVQDHGGNICPDTIPPFANISGEILTDDGRPVYDVAVKLLDESIDDDKTIMTGNNGVFQFAGLPINHNYEIKAEKSDLATNGVSTLDIVLIQRHILGNTLFESPFKMIAADVDNNGKVSVSDLVLLRRLILSVMDSFPNGQKPWRFVHDNTNVVNDQDPFQYRESIHVQNLTEDRTDMNFVAVKTGDVNGTATLHAREQPEIRQNETLEFVFDIPAEIEPGDLFIIPVSTQHLKDILGFQFTLNFEPVRMNFVKTMNGKLKMDHENLGKRWLWNGQLSISWNDVMPVSLAPEDTLFSLVFENLTEWANDHGISINSRQTIAEAYTGDLQVMGLTMRRKSVNTGQTASTFQIGQNTPNPFDEFTIIGFSIPEEGMVHFTVYNMSGKVVFTMDKIYEEGYNEILLNKTDVKAAGILYYQIQMNEFRSVRKMLVLQ